MHPGVLISGHRMNGHNATWTCCGSRRHADGCMQLVHAPADGCDLRHEAKQGRTVVASCTGVPGSRVRGWNAMEQRTFLDMITS
mmetsp:Transcript_35318/g.110372  ORF Transcript_35318/g.110372 Transcript_35318/m.110372 type:complete len:84 (-) Transcript_35318:789-1040(-)